MTKKRIIILISVVLGLFLIALIGYFFIIQGGPNAPGGIASKFKGFFPFGGEETPAPTPEPEPTTPQPKPTNYTQKLRKLSTAPVSGAGTLDVKAGTLVRYIEKATGHIYETELFSPNSNRISNTTIPVVYDAVWGNKNNSLVARYLRADNQSVDTYSLTVKEVATSSENTISGIAFPSNIGDVSVFETNVFYLKRNLDSSTGFVSSFDGKKIKEIWNSPIRELLSQFVNVKTVALTTKPAQGMGGFLYFVDTSSGQIKKILANIPGLSTLVSPDGTQVLYLSGNQIYIHDLKSGLSQKTTPVTFPEKCAWSKKDKNIIYCAVPKENIGGASLLSWYQGFISLTDDIWKYDIKNNTSSLIENLSNDSGESIDVIKPLLSENEQYLVFMNKRDNFLWSLDLMK